MTDEYLLELVWRRAFLLAFLQIAAVVYVCYLGLTALFFAKRETSFGILCTVCALFPLAQPAGVLLGLLFGWSRARRWQIRAFMSVWTALVAVAALDFVAALVLRQLDPATLRLLFAFEA